VQFHPGNTLGSRASAGGDAIGQYVDRAADLFLVDVPSLGNRLDRPQKG
jgi:hypothetical protein